MWDKPDVLNTISNALFAAAFLIVAYGAVYFVVRSPAFPLREVHVTGELAHVTPEEIESVVMRELKGSFFTLDLKAARVGFEALPWVRKSDVRRRWPDRLELEFEEHVPLARWGAEALVNTYGEVFTAAYDGAPASREQGSRLRDATAELAVNASQLPAPCESPGSDAKGNPVPPCDAPRLRDASGRESGALPLFIGPEGSAKEIAIQYRYFQRSLAAIGQVPVQVQVSARRAWQVRLASGLTVEFRRDRIEARLDRFIASYEGTVGRLQRKLDYVDLRYPNGFAVRIPELKSGPRDQHRGADNRTKRG